MIKRNNLPILRDQDRFFNEVFSDFFGDNESWMKSTKAISCDIQEVDDHFVFSMDIPGVKKEDIRVEVKNGHLVVTAKRDNVSEHKEGGHYLRRERSYGEFTRAFKLSDDIDTEIVEASYENGVLHLAVPKKAEKQAKLVEIKSEKSTLLGKLLS
jgi:HSP20 family protein